MKFFCFLTTYNFSISGPPECATPYVQVYTPDDGMIRPVWYVRFHRINARYS